MECERIAMRASPLICDYREPNQSVWRQLAKRNHKSQRKKKGPPPCSFNLWHRCLFALIKIWPKLQQEQQKAAEDSNLCYKLLMSVCQEHAVKMIQCFGSSFGCSLNERSRVNLQKLKQKAGGELAKTNCAPHGKHCHTRD